MTDFKNIVLIVLSFGVPIFLVLGIRGWKGILIGALALWALVLVTGVSGSPNHPEDRAIGSVVWMLIGWLVGVFYCIFIRWIQNLMAFRK